MSKRENDIYHMGENKEDDLESILSFDSEMNSIYSEKNNNSSKSDIK